MWFGGSNSTSTTAQSQHGDNTTKYYASSQAYSQTNYENPQQASFYQQSYYPYQQAPGAANHDQGQGQSYTPSNYDGSNYYTSQPQVLYSNQMSGWNQDTYNVYQPNMTGYDSAQVSSYTQSTGEISRGNSTQTSQNSVSGVGGLNYSKTLDQMPKQSLSFRSCGTPRVTSIDPSQTSTSNHRTQTVSQAVSEALSSNQVSNQTMAAKPVPAPTYCQPSLYAGQQNYYVTQSYGTDNQQSAQPYGHASHQSSQSSVHVNYQREQFSYPTNHHGPRPTGPSSCQTPPRGPWNSQSKAPQPAPTNFEGHSSGTSNWQDPHPPGRNNLQGPCPGQSNFQGSHSGGPNFQGPHPGQPNFQGARPGQSNFQVSRPKQPNFQSPHSVPSACQSHVPGPGNYQGPRYRGPPTKGLSLGPSHSQGPSTNSEDHHGPVSTNPQSPYPGPSNAGDPHLPGPNSYPTPSPGRRNSQGPHPGPSHPESHPSRPSRHQSLRSHGSNPVFPGTNITKTTGYQDPYSSDSINHHSLPARGQIDPQTGRPADPSNQQGTQSYDQGQPMQFDRPDSQGFNTRQFGRPETSISRDLEGPHISSYGAENNEMEDFEECVEFPEEDFQTAAEWGDGTYYDDAEAVYSDDDNYQDLDDTGHTECDLDSQVTERAVPVLSLEEYERLYKDEKNLRIKKLRLLACKAIASKEVLAIGKVCNSRNKTLCLRVRHRNDKDLAAATGVCCVVHILFDDALVGTGAAHLKVQAKRNAFEIALQKIYLPFLRVFRGEHGYMEIQGSRFPFKRGSYRQFMRPMAALSREQLAMRNGTEFKDRRKQRQILLDTARNRGRNKKRKFHKGGFKKKK